MKVTGMVIIALTVVSAPSATGQVLQTSDFQQIAPEGFGDIHNNVAWSMTWWNGKLYVGTNRDWFCWSVASFVTSFPPLGFLYPPNDPGFCTQDYRDLPLQAEIWRWTPSTSIWDRVYQSPENVPIVGDPLGRFSSRDIGYRGMGLFTESDGSGNRKQNLYVASVNSGPVNDAPGPPRILRSTDGNTFAPVPQDPGTFLGTLSKNSLRDIVEFKEKFYIVSGSIQGAGVLLESPTPSLGNNTFRVVTPPGMVIWDMAAFNGHLYVGTQREVSGPTGTSIVFELLKTDGTGAPFTFKTVIANGGHLTPEPSRSTVSMRVFNNSLYVGTDRPAELYRVHADDTWELIVGEPRTDPMGNLITPLSGIGPGFDWPLNIHLWRMGDYKGALYVGTADSSSRYLNLPVIGPLLEPMAGFDLFGSIDDVFWSPLTQTGFGDKYQMGARTFASPGDAIYLGTSNLHGGAEVWRGVAPAPAVAAARLQPPSRVDAEVRPSGVVVSWNASPGAVRYIVFRTAFTSAGAQLREAVEQSLTASGLPVEAVQAASAEAKQALIPSAPVKLGVSTSFFFVDSTAPSGAFSHYYVIALDALGRVSAPSNVARGPSLAPSVTFARTQALVSLWYKQGKIAQLPTIRDVITRLTRAQVMVRSGDLAGADTALTSLQQLVRDTANDPRIKTTIDIMIGRLARRVRLAQAGLVTASDLD